MAEQKKETREGLQDEMVAIHILIKWKWPTSRPLK
jgi:hypothetical protein